MIPTASAMSTALPASASADNAFLIATVPMPASPITSAAMRAALPEMARALASAVGGAAGATAAAAASSSKPASQPRSSTPPERNVPRNAAAAYRTFVTQRTPSAVTTPAAARGTRSEEHTSELQSRLHLVCRLLLEKKKKTRKQNSYCMHTY